MNIVWTIGIQFESDAQQTLTVSPSDVWKDISLSKPNRKHIMDTETVDITHKGETFKDITTHFYMIEN